MLSNRLNNYCHTFALHAQFDNVHRQKSKQYQQCEWGAGYQTKLINSALTKTPEALKLEQYDSNHNVLHSNNIETYCF